MQPISAQLQRRVSHEISPGRKRGLGLLGYHEGCIKQRKILWIVVLLGTRILARICSSNWPAINRGKTKRRGNAEAEPKSFYPKVDC